MTKKLRPQRKIGQGCVDAGCPYLDAVMARVSSDEPETVMESFYRLGCVREDCPKESRMIILGIDANTTELGLAVIEAGSADFSVSLIVDTVLFAESLKLNGTRALAERYVALAQRVEEVCILWQPDGVAIESTYIGHNKQTGIKLATAVGAAFYAVARHVPVDNIHLLSPVEIKAAITGNSHASKKAVMDAVEYTTGTKPATEHIADAAAAARALADRLRLLQREEEMEREA